MEANLNGEPIDASNPEILAAAEETNSDKSITAVSKARNETEIDPGEENRAESYQETMNIDIDKIKIATNIIQKKLDNLQSYTTRVP